MSSLLGRALAGWRTGLSVPVVVLQAGSAVNYFDYGLIVSFEIVYLHQARGFTAATAGLVLPVIMGATGKPSSAWSSAAPGPESRTPRTEFCVRPYAPSSGAEREQCFAPRQGL